MFEINCKIKNVYEPEMGEIIKCDNTHLRVIEREKTSNYMNVCDGCYFNCDSHSGGSFRGNCLIPNQYRIRCHSSQRIDNKNIIFVVQ